MDEKVAETLRKSRQLLENLKKQQDLYKTSQDTQKALAESGYVGHLGHSYGAYGYGGLQGSYLGGLGGGYGYPYGYSGFGHGLAHGFGGYYPTTSHAYVSSLVNQPAEAPKEEEES